MPLIQYCLENTTHITNNTAKLMILKFYMTHNCNHNIFWWQKYQIIYHIIKLNIENIIFFFIFLIFLIFLIFWLNLFLFNNSFLVYFNGIIKTFHIWHNFISSFINNIYFLGFLLFLFVLIVKFASPMISNIAFLFTSKELFDFLNKIRTI